MQFGCDEYGYAGREGTCTNQAFPVFSPLYFSLLVLICTLVYLNLFVAVVTTSMTNATSEDKSSTFEDDFVPDPLKSVEVKATECEDKFLVQWMFDSNVVFDKNKLKLAKEKDPWGYYFDHYTKLLKYMVISTTFQYIIGFIIIVSAVVVGVQISHPTGGLARAMEVRCPIFDRGVTYM